MFRRDDRTLAPRSLRAAGVGALIAAVMFLPGLGTGTLWDNSETAYGEVAREILLTHDAVVMHLDGFAWYIQPPLYFWLGALCAKVFGLSTFALRLPSAMAAIAAAAATAYVAARATGERAGLLAAAVLSTALMQAVVGRLAIMDALLDTAVTCAILAWYVAADRARGTPRDAAVAWVLGWASLALGTLAKGVVAPVLTVAVVGVWAFWERRIARAGAGTAPAWPPLRVTALGAVVALALVAPWALLEYREAGAAAFGEMIVHYTVGRYTGVIENQTGPLWYYVPVVVLGFFPWIAYLGPAVRFAWRDRTPRASLGRLALVWSVVPLVFFSCAKTKLPNYIALELPALAILVGIWFDAAAFATSRRTALVWTAVVPLIFIALLVGMFRFTDTNSLGPAFATMKPDLFVFIGVNLLGSLICFACFARDAAARFAPYVLAGATIAGWLFVASIGESHAESFKPIPRLAAIIDAQRRPGDTVSVLGVSGGNALTFYTAPETHALAPFDEEPSTPGADPHRAICGGARAFVIVSKKRPSVDPTFGRSRRELAASANDVLFLYDGHACTRGPLPYHHKHAPPAAS